MHLTSSVTQATFQPQLRQLQPPIAIPGAMAYAYHWVLEAAKAHLSALNAPEPIMPPFDPSKYEPMPEVEIDPDDEYHVGDQTLEDLLREIDALEG
jgi:hypothetical protein